MQFSDLEYNGTSYQDIVAALNPKRKFGACHLDPDIRPLARKTSPADWMPYQMVATNERYYLICNYDKYDNLSNYRIDRITNIRLLNTPVKPQSQVKGMKHGLNLPKHIYQNAF